MRKTYLFPVLLLGILIYFVLSCEDDFSQQEETPNASKTKSYWMFEEEKKITDIFSIDKKEITPDEAAILEEIYQEMLQDCVFQHVDQLIRKGHPWWVRKGKVIFNPNFKGIMGLTSEGNLMISGAINISNKGTGRLLQALKHEFLHMYQVEFCKTSLFQVDTGMAEFEAFVFLDILQYVKDKNETNRHEWALHPDVNVGLFAANSYELWLGRLTRGGKRIPDGTEICPEKFAHHSSNFGKYNKFYNSLGYTYGNYYYHACTLTDLLNYANRNCN